jgi:hypothetical protein
MRELHRGKNGRNKKEKEKQIRADKKICALLQKIQVDFGT